MATSCSCYNKALTTSGSRIPFIKFGSYRRKSDGFRSQRYRCSHCKKTFSDASASACFGQKKRHLNQVIYQDLVSGVSQRRIAFLKKINRKTVVKKYILMGDEAIKLLPLMNHHHLPAQVVQFDDLETFEHTKCKPLSVIMMVEHPSRRILGFRVASMPCKGRLAQISLKKYGVRKDERKELRQELFRELQPFIDPNAEISSDQSPHYPNDVKAYFPKATHTRYKGRKPSPYGLGELKKGPYDPLFTLNHTFAMYRANINRLFRKTWCTTKFKENLTRHIALYSLYHNLVLIKKANQEIPAEFILPQLQMT